MIEDLFLALYLAALAPVLGGADTAGEATCCSYAAGFLVVLGLAARYGGRWIGRVVTAAKTLLVILSAGFAC